MINMMDEISSYTSVYGPNEPLEKAVFAQWINHCLQNDKLTSHHLPISPGNDELYEKLSDGLVLIQLVNYHFPNSIHPRAIFSDIPITRRNKLKNIALAFITAICYGCNLDSINIYQVFSGVKTVILEMIWQIIKVGFTYEVNVINYPDLMLLRKQTESLYDFREVSASQLVLRYINYQLSRSGGSGNVESYFDNFSDGNVYYNLVLKLFPNSSPLHARRGSSKDDKIIVKIQMAMNILEENKANFFLKSEMFVNSLKNSMSVWKFHFLQFHWFFRNFRLEYHETVSKDIGNVEENKEKFLRNFLNSFGLEPFCNDLSANNRNSLLLMRLLMTIDRLGFRDRGFISVFDENYSVSERIHNAALILNRMDEYKIKEDNLYPEYIAKSHKETIKNLLIKLLGWWLMKGNINVKELKNWVNKLMSTRSKPIKISSFRDIKIYRQYIFAIILDILEPKNINFDFLKCMDVKEFTQYYVSIARRCGYLIFTIPEQFMACEYDFIVLAFATLMYNKKHNNISCPGYE